MPGMLKLGAPADTAAWGMEEKGKPGEHRVRRRDPFIVTGLTGRKCLCRPYRLRHWWTSKGSTPLIC